MRRLFSIACVAFSIGTATAQTPPSQATSQETTVPTGKLPDTATPTAYRIDFTILPESPTFSGHTEIDATLNESATKIYIHGRDLDVSEATVEAGGRSFPITFEQVNPFGLARIDFGRELPAGRITLKFDYEGSLTEDQPSGLYRVNVEDQWYSWTQFQSIDARAAFPGFDEPGYKTPFTVSIATAPGNVALSNMPQLREETEGNLVRHYFAKSPPLPTYLVALVTGPFVTAETTIPATPQRSEPIPLRIVATQPNAERMQFALEESGPIVALLESYFDQAFPFPKLDQIGSPIMPGAMENAGADIYGDDILLLAEDATRDDKRLFGMVIAHELAHQWFGDYATPAWWDDIWLNESFANWMGYRIGSEWRPDLDIDNGAVREGFDAMDLDSLTVGRPIHERITDDSNVDSAFDQITYGKGGQVVAMIAEYLGDEKFRDGVRLHMKRHSYGTAATDDFFASLATAADDPRVLDALRSFVDQQGVPLITLRREGDGYVATQQPYAHLGTTPEPRQWIVPLCVRRGDAERVCTLLDQPRMALPAVPGDGPLIPNAGGQGYYRFDLPSADWNALIATADTLPAGEAIAVADSLWAGFRSGRLPVESLVAAAHVFASHPDHEVSVEIGQGLARLKDQGLISEAAEPAWRATIADIYRPALQGLGSDLASGTYAEDDSDRRKLRADLIDLVAGAGADAELRTRLLTALDAYLAGDHDALDPAFVGTAARIAANERGAAFAAQALQQNMLGALTQSDNPEIGQFLMTTLTSDSFPAQYRLSALYELLGSPGARDAAFAYLSENFGELAGNGGGIFFARGGGAFGQLCTAEAADTLENTMIPAVEGAGGTLSLRRSVERIRNCVAFRGAKAESVSEAFLSIAE
ncbi:M1 family metallopeptidase [Stakelama tenebrarum]|uniref:Aminopeptidase n=1 Tax=Stakelama tenebrarum TaxID=2711215 RepID=A0A6G6Y613_9SPHN|nr:M1 family metallopeptidase [Sphingosinithalassobacter tenebrarum]QIG80350.1 M1 family metallopeptidase [Sphingosinithalassobacter tenebrarum]